MVFDERADEEPDEPEFDVWDGEELVPDPPEPDFTDQDVPTEVKTAFWSVVLLVKVGLLGISVGPMFLYFTDYTRVGLGLIAIGVFTFASAYRRYRIFMNQSDDSEPSSAEESAAAGDAASTRNADETGDSPTGGSSDPEDPGAE